MVIKWCWISISYFWQYLCDLDDGEWGLTYNLDIFNQTLLHLTCSSLQIYFHLTWGAGVTLAVVNHSEALTTLRLALGQLAIFLAFASLSPKLIFLLQLTTWWPHLYHNWLISPEGYEQWHPHNWPVTTTNHLPPHLANYLRHQRVSVFV